MTADELKLQDLRHIEAVIARLENLNLAGCASAHRFITDIAYWQKRLLATCVAADSQRIFEERQRLLDRLSAMSSCVRKRSHA
jgi:hypothetical protein